MPFPQLNNTDYVLLTAIAIGAILYVVFRYRNRQREDVNPSTSLPRPVTLAPIEANDPLQDVADTLDIPLWYVKQSLGIPLIGACLATTIEDANDIYDNAEAGSEEEYFALLKIIELEEDVDNLSGIQENTEPFPPLRELYAAKMDTLLLKQIGTSSSEDELIEAYGYALYETDSDKAIIKKLYELYKE